MCGGSSRMSRAVAAHACHRSGGSPPMHQVTSLAKQRGLGQVNGSSGLECFFDGGVAGDGLLEADEFDDAPDDSGGAGQA